MKHFIKLFAIIFCCVIGAVGVGVGILYLSGGFEQKKIAPENLSFVKNDIIITGATDLKVITSTLDVTETELNISVYPSGVIKVPSKIKLNERFIIWPETEEIVTRNANGDVVNTHTCNVGGKVEITVNYGSTALAKCKVFVDVQIEEIEVLLSNYTSNGINITEGDTFSFSTNILPEKSLNPNATTFGIAWTGDLASRVQAKKIYYTLEYANGTVLSFDEETKTGPAYFLVNGQPYGTMITSDIVNDPTKTVLIQTANQITTGLNFFVKAYVFKTLNEAEKYATANFSTAKQLMLQDKEASSDETALINYNKVGDNVFYTIVYGTDDDAVTYTYNSLQNKFLDIDGNEFPFTITSAMSFPGPNETTEIKYFKQRNTQVTVNTYQIDSMTSTRNGSTVDINLYEDYTLVSRAESSSGNNRIDLGISVLTDAVGADTSNIDEYINQYVTVDIFDNNGDAVDTFLSIIGREEVINGIATKSQKAITSAGYATATDNWTWDLVWKFEDGNEAKLYKALDTTFTVRISYTAPDSEIAYIDFTIRVVTCEASSITAKPESMSKFNRNNGESLVLADSDFTTLPSNSTFKAIKYYLSNQQDSLSFVPNKIGTYKFTFNYTEDIDFTSDMLLGTLSCDINTENRTVVVTGYEKDFVETSKNLIFNTELCNLNYIYNLKFFEEETEGSGTYTRYPYLMVNDVIQIVSDFEYHDANDSYVYVLLKGIVDTSNGTVYADKLKGIGTFDLLVKPVFSTRDGQPLQDENGNYIWENAEQTYTITVIDVLESVTLEKIIQNPEDEIKIISTDTTIEEGEYILTEGGTYTLFISGQSVDAFTNNMVHNVAELSIVPCYEGQTQYSGISEINTTPATLNGNWVYDSEEHLYKINFTMPYVYALYYKNANENVELDVIFKITLRIGNVITNGYVKVFDNRIRNAAIYYGDVSNPTFADSENPMNIQVSAVDANGNIQLAQLNADATEAAGAFDISQLFYGLYYTNAQDTLTSDYMQEDVICQTAGVSLSNLIYFSDDGLVIKNVPYLEDGILVRIKISSFGNSELNTYKLYNDGSFTTVNDIEANFYINIYGLNIEATIAETAAVVGTKGTTISISDRLDFACHDHLGNEIGLPDVTKLIAFDLISENTYGNFACANGIVEVVRYLISTTEIIIGLKIGQNNLQVIDAVAERRYETYPITVTAPFETKFKPEEPESTTQNDEIVAPTAAPINLLDIIESKYGDTIIDAASETFNLKYSLIADESNSFLQYVTVDNENEQLSVANVPSTFTFGLNVSIYTKDIHTYINLSELPVFENSVTFAGNVYNYDVENFKFIYNNGSEDIELFDGKYIYDIANEKVYYYNNGVGSAIEFTYNTDGFYLNGVNLNKVVTYSWSTASGNLLTYNTDQTVLVYYLLNSVDLTFTVNNEYSSESVVFDSYDKQLDLENNFYVISYDGTIYVFDPDINNFINSNGELFEYSFDWDLEKDLVIYYDSADTSHFLRLQKTSDATPKFYLERQNADKTAYEQYFFTDAFVIDNNDLSLPYNAIKYDYTLGSESVTLASQRKTAAITKNALHNTYSVAVGNVGSQVTYQYDEATETFIDPLGNAFPYHIVSFELVDSGSLIYYEYYQTFDIQFEEEESYIVFNTLKYYYNISVLNESLTNFPYPYTIDWSSQLISFTTEGGTSSQPILNDTNGYYFEYSGLYRYNIVRSFSLKQGTMLNVININFLGDGITYAPGSTCSYGGTVTSIDYDGVAKTYYILVTMGEKQYRFNYTYDFVSGSGQSIGDLKSGDLGALHNLSEYFHRGALHTEPTMEIGFVDATDTSHFIYDIVKQKAYLQEYSSLFIVEVGGIIYIYDAEDDAFIAEGEDNLVIEYIDKDKLKYQGSDELQTIYFDGTRQISMWKITVEDVDYYYNEEEDKFKTLSGQIFNYPIIYLDFVRGNVTYLNEENITIPMSNFVPQGSYKLGSTTYYYYSEIGSYMFDKFGKQIPLSINSISENKINYIYYENYILAGISNGADLTFGGALATRTEQIDSITVEFADDDGNDVSVAGATNNDGFMCYDSSNGKIYSYDLNSDVNVHLTITVTFKNNGGYTIISKDIVVVANLVIDVIESASISKNATQGVGLLATSFYTNRIVRTNNDLTKTVVSDDDIPNYIKITNDTAEEDNYFNIKTGSENVASIVMNLFEEPCLVGNENLHQALQAFVEYHYWVQTESGKGYYLTYTFKFEITV